MQMKIHLNLHQKNLRVFVICATFMVIHQYLSGKI